MLIGLNHLQGDMLLPSVARGVGTQQSWKRQTVGAQRRGWPQRSSQEEEGVKLAAMNEMPPRSYPRGQLPWVLAPEVP